MPKSTPQVPPAVDCSLRDARRRSAGQKSKIAEVNAQQSAVNASKFHWFFLTLKDIDEKDLYKACTKQNKNNRRINLHAHYIVNVTTVHHPFQDHERPC